jgi:preprotein translocase subunit YajC
VNWLTVGWIALVLIGGWFLLVLPRRRLREQQTAMRTDLGPGDEVITVGGIIGRVQSVDDDEVQLEIAPEVVVRVVRRGVAGRLAPDEPEDPEPAADEEP